MTAEQRPCAACNAEPGEPCRWDCIGLAAEVDRLDELIPDAVCARCAGCPRCRLARLAVENLPGWTDGLIGRAMTVQTSKLYAALHYRAELDAHHGGSSPMRSAD